MEKIYRFFRSVRLAVTLILVITAFSILATLVPQGQPEAFYQENYSQLIFMLVTGLQLDRAFTSVLFLVPAFLFIVNLTVCTAHRLLTRLRTKAKHRHGPDLIHLGLLVLLVGGIVTAAMRQEKLFFMSEGEQVELPGEIRITLLSFETLVYEDGRPRDWVSTIAISDPKSPGTEQRTASIEVNKPHSLGSIKLYQTSFDKNIIAHLADAEGALQAISGGQGFDQGDELWVFADVRTAPDGTLTAVFDRYRERTHVGSLLVGEGQTIGPYSVRSMAVSNMTGLTAVRDPGYLPVLIGLIVSVLGLSLTFVQKIGDQKV